VSGDRDSNSSGASGDGGAGRVTGDGQQGDGDPDEQSPELATVYDPIEGDGGEQLTVGGGEGTGEGGTIGSDDGPTGRGASRVPLAEAITDYADQASGAMDAAIVAPSDRRLVTDYFDQLQNGAAAS
jgi:hypothetical protein